MYPVGEPRSIGVILRLRRIREANPAERGMTSSNTRSEPRRAGNDFVEYAKRAPCCRRYFDFIESA